MNTFGVEKKRKVTIMTDIEDSKKNKLIFIQTKSNIYKSFWRTFHELLCFS